MARRELPLAALTVATAVAAGLPDGDVVVGCSGGADSLALALGAAWAARRAGTRAEAVVVDHGLQPGSAEVARRVVARLDAVGVPARAQRVEVRPGADGVEAAARDARLATLAEPGLPVLLGHTLDDQAETVLLGLLRGSGTRSLAGMAPVRGLFRRPLLGLRRADTEAACRAWGVEWWEDPMNDDPSFARVGARRALATLAVDLGRDVAPALARTARLARADADLLDALAEEENRPVPDGALRVEDLRPLPDALRWRVLRSWLRNAGLAPSFEGVLAVDAFVTGWRGQGPTALPGGAVARVGGELHITAG
ncbi:MAG: tRNA lysidine(34) synthetase TilS [Tessaracoccus sp.]|uniref:tRNA lysidine(34) synthetase TilS n=1 Tax=Tessaracoccus sp. TaxID=1971211 RepID=UPI001EBBC5BD|nr:tRNA lysidine(34) synthetase TilS [Tessaracoccus sp.]MBK7822590.1 tRNA lysidine(34) synthetase TilS [Tessaracoccus sp.]